MMRNDNENYLKYIFQTCFALVFRKVIEKFPFGAFKIFICEFFWTDSFLLSHNKLHFQIVSTLLKNIFDARIFRKDFEHLLADFDSISEFF